MNPTSENEPFAPLPAAAPVPTMTREQFEQQAKRQRENRPREPDPMHLGAGAADWLKEFRRKPTAEELAEDARLVAERKAEKEREERAIALREWEQATPDNLRATDWKHPKLIPYQTEISRVRTWKRGARGIYAAGASGRGKSRSVYALARRLAVDELVPVRYLMQTDITREVNRDGLNGFLEKLDGVRRCPILVWDDFGKFAAIGSRKELLVSEIEALIDFRFSHGLPFLISTNARDADLISIFGDMRGEPIMRRLVEGCEVVNFGW
jgi:DNA replication protein DnaC